MNNNDLTGAPIHPSNPASPDYPKQPNVQPPNAQPSFPNLPGEPVSEAEHQVLKAHREERQKKWAELEKMAAELGGGVTGKPGEVRLKHRPSQAQRDAGRPSGLSVDQEAENSILLDDTERNIMHREKEMKDAKEADQKAANVREREAARFTEERNAKKTA